MVQNSNCYRTKKSPSKYILLKVLQHTNFRFCQFVKKKDTTKDQYDKVVTGFRIIENVPNELFVTRGLH